MISRIKRLFKGEYSSSLIFFIFLILGMLIYYPYINNHFNYDDFIFVSAIEEKIDYNPLIGFWDIDFRDIPSFNSMWWVDADADGTFFRPLPTLIFSTMFKLFGRDSALYLHLFYVFMHILAAFTAFVFLKTLTNKYSVSLLAGFLFLFCVHHSMTVGWISAGTDITCVIFMNLALYNYALYRQRGIFRYQVYSIVFTLLALACKETAVITPVAVLLIEFIYYTEGAFWRRIKTMFVNFGFVTPAVILLIGFLAFHKLSGFAMKSIMYNDVFINPSAYFKGLITGYPIMLLGLLSVLPISISMFFKNLEIYFVLGGIVVSAMFIAALWKNREDKNVQFTFLLFAVSLLPQLSVDASERQLYYPYTVGAFLISLLILQIPWLKKITGDESPQTGGLFSKILSYYLLISSVIITLPYSFSQPQMFAQSLRAPEKFVLQANDAIGAKKYEHLIYLNTPGSMNTLYMGDIHRYHAGKYKDITLLASFDGKLWMKKNSDSSVSIKSDKAGMLTGMFQRLVRTNPVVQQGRIYNKKNYDVLIVRTTEDKLDALEIRFDFHYNLNNTSTIFLYYDGDKMKMWDFPAQRLEEWMFVGDTSNIMKNMM